MNSTVAEITPVAQRLVKDYLAIKQGENFLIVTDTRTSSEIATALMEEAIALGCDAASIVITPRTRSGENPPPHCAAAMKAAQVIVAAASTSLYHTQAKAEAQQAGARGVLNAPFMAEAWANGAMTADFREIRPVAERLRDILKTGKTLRLTSPAGTELVASIEGRKPVGWLTALCREAGQISALPGGEVSLPPVEGTAEGRIVIEQVMSDLGRIEQPLELIVRGGNVIEVNGGAREQAERLNTILNTIPNARNIAEIGIGLNPKARLTDQITETKKRLGTAHIVVGDNARDYGGSVKCAVHLDGMILDVTIELDGKKIVEEGRTLLSDNLSGPEMITPYPGTRTSDLIERLRRVEGSGMRTAAELPLVAIESANGVFVTDPDGNRYLDLYAGFAAANIGHAHPRVTAAIQAQAAILTHVSSAYPTSTRAELLEKLLSLAPSGLTRGLFAITGGQANDLALRIARRATGRNEFIAFYGGYFGRDAGVLGLNSKAMFRRGLGIHPGAHFFPFPYAYRCPFGNQHSNPEECAQECLTFLESALRLFVGNDLPGVISARLVERLITEEGIAPGKRAVIWDTPGQSQAIASVMQGAGIEIVHHLQSGESILAAKGGKKVRAVIVRNADGSTRTVPCDLVVIAALQSRNKLLAQAGGQLQWDEAANGLCAIRDHTMQTSVAGIRVAGEAAGAMDSDHCILEARLAGLSALQDLGLDGFEAEINQLKSQLAYTGQDAVMLFPSRSLNGAGIFVFVNMFWSVKSRFKSTTAMTLWN